MARTLETVAAENTEEAVIHAVAIDAGRLQRNFLQALIAASDGLFVEIDP